MSLCGGERFDEIRERRSGREIEERRAARDPAERRRRHQASRWSATSGPQNNFPAQRAAFAQGALLLQTMGGGGLGQRQDAVDVPLQLALHQPTADGLGGGALLLRGGVEQLRTLQ